MKYVVFVCFYFAFAKACFSQFNNKSEPSYHIEISYIYGTIMEHNPDIAHLITGHPAGFIAQFNKHTYGDKEWQALYGYPDYGLSFTYQDLINESLGDAYGVYAHYNFYAFKRKLQYGIGTGIAYMTNPYDPVTNFRNVAYGTRLASATYFKLNYREEQLFKNIGFQAGITLIHYSNGNIKEPNTSTNSLMFNAGLSYTVRPKEPTYKKWEKSKYSEPLSFNLVLRHGWNESNVRGSGQFPFLTLSTYLDKRLNKKSSLHGGLDVMYTGFLEEYRDFQANSFPNSRIIGDENTLRLGLTLGHELHIGKISVLTSLGYYVYDEINYGSDIYNRIGIQRKFNNWFVNLTLKSHAASAEGLSLGIGYRI